MSALCEATPCPVILNATCVFYEGANLVYTGINTNDSLQVALQKIDAKFEDAGLGYIFTNGVSQSAPGQPVKLGGTLIENTTITSSGFWLKITGDLEAGAHVTTGGLSSQFVKGDGSLDGTSYQPAGSYITALTGDGTASGPGSAVFTLATVNPLSAGTWGSSTQVPIVTVNAKGLITSITTTLISIPSDIISVSGPDMFGSGVTGVPFAITLATVNANVYGVKTPLKFTVNGKGLVTSAAPITNLDLDGIYGYTPVPSSRVLTINGVSYDLSANRSWTVSAGSVAWGNIIGTITDQTDLITYLSTNYTPQARTLTINGVTYDLSADRSWTVSGSSGYTVISVTTTPYNISQTSGMYVFLINTTSAGGNVVINLPTPVGNTAEYTFKKVDSGVGNITINPGAFTIDGDTSAIIYYQNTSGTMISDNSNWKIIN